MYRYIFDITLKAYKICSNMKAKHSELRIVSPLIYEFKYV